jgi:uracil permease
MKQKAKNALLAFQHVFAMFGATVLVPFLTGLDPSVALLSAGLGTLLFHWLTGGVVPVFLGSSFAFIGGTAWILQTEGIGSLKTGIMAAGLVYVAVAWLVKKLGTAWVDKVFPPMVVAPMILLIGLRLAPVAIGMIQNTQNASSQSAQILVAIVVVLSILLVSVLGGSFFRLFPILIGMFVGYCTAYFLGLIDLTGIANADWFGFSTETWQNIITPPTWSLRSISLLAPISLVVFVEHLGDIKTNSEVVGKDFVKTPGLHRTLLGDGLATLLAGFLGAPANTTYGENTGVLAVTKNYNPAILRLAAIFAVFLSMLGKFSALLQSIPSCVMGGVSLVLFGMIASIGLRIFQQAQIDFSHSRNLLIVSLIFTLGLGIDQIAISPTVQVSGLTLSVLVGIFLNLVLPKKI